MNPYLTLTQEHGLSRRNTELLLLIGASFPVLLVYATYVLAAGNTLSIETLLVPLFLMLAFAIAHLFVRFLAPEADPCLLPIVYVLSGIGITFVTRLKPELAINQVIWLFLAIAMMVVTLLCVRNIDRLAKYKYTIGAVGVVLILLPMIFGETIGGSKLWLQFGPVSFQPGELAKICIVVFLGAYLAENRELLSASSKKVGPLTIPSFKMLLPVFIMWGLSLLIVVFESDLGSALLFFTIFVIMLYVCTGRVSYVIISLVLLAIGAVGCYLLFHHVRVRFNIWIDPFQDAQGGGMQIVQSLYSLADGGFMGTGLGKGLPTLIPVVESDFIFSAIGEEMGLLGASAVLLLFMLFAVRGFTTAARAKSDIAAFTAVGLTTSICFQAFLIVGGVTKFMPLTGVTLPFMSQGGSSLLASFVVVGLLLRCGDQGTGHSTLLLGGGVKEARSKNTNENIGGKKGFFTKSGKAASSAALLKAARKKPSKSQKAHIKTQGTHAPASRSVSMRFKRPAARVSYGMETPESGVLGRVALSRRLTALVTFFAVLFAALIANLTFIQVIEAQDLRTMANNNHTILRSSKIERGPIITSDDVTLAESVKQDNGTYKRVYPQGSLAAHTVGYLSSQYGAAGVEASLNEQLSGHSSFTNWISAFCSLAGIQQPGNTVQLTLNSKIQKACNDALKGYTGAVVVLDPSTGAVLGKSSAPTYDIGSLGSIMSDSSSSALLDRTTQALYAPGSTFKVVTLSSALDSGKTTLDSTFKAPARIEIGNGSVTNDANRAYGTLNLKRALAVSANTVFGQLAVQVGSHDLVKYAKAFGYEQKIGIDFTVVPSVMPDPSEMTDWETAWAGCGQPVGEHKSDPGPQTTVMQNAVVAATIANKGVAMKPYIVQQILDPNETTLIKTRPSSLGQVLSLDATKSVAEAMLAVTTNGTGTAAASGAGVQVAGKTGTAETGKDINSLFIGFAPYDNPKIAISICLEGTPDKDVEGSAARIAGKIISACLNVLKSN